VCAPASAGSTSLRLVKVLTTDEHGWTRLMDADFKRDAAVAMAEFHATPEEVRIDAQSPNR
jgi:hypothetical protein